MAFYAKQIWTLSALASASVAVGCNTGKSQATDSESQMSGGTIRTVDSQKIDDPLGYTVRIDLGPRNDYGCTGTLIDKRVVLTAAHCRVVVGNAVTLKAGNTISKYKVQKVIVEESFVNKDAGETETDWANVASVDFTLLLLDQETIGRPVQLADKSPPQGAQVTVSGFGLNTDDWLPDGMLRTAQNTVEKMVLSTLHKGKAIIKTTKVNGISCSGDSGGPLMYQGRLTGVLHGGGGDGTCKGKRYSLYASVAHHLAWITESKQTLLNSAKQPLKN